MTVEGDLIDEIRPDDDLRKEVQQVTGKLLQKVRTISSRYPEIEDVRLVGSVAKDTFVSKPDIDIFILFNVKTDRTVMNRIGLFVGKEALVEREERYAEHPYTHGIIDGYEADIVPCYKIKDTSEMMTAVDRTPFHTEYVMKNLLPAQRDEVRLLKQFLKGIGAYGAEAKVQGFSGYLVELLILKYGTFTGTIMAASEWKMGTKIELGGESGNKFKTPLVFIDPVDASRNVASALSPERFSIFVYASNEYLRSPKRTFFFPEKRHALSKNEIEKKLKELGHGALIASCKKPDLVDDNLYPQAKKTTDGLAIQLENDGFSVIGTAISVEDVELRMAFLLETLELSDCRKHIGPPVTLKNADEFLNRWRGKAVLGPYIEGDRWVAIIKRDVTDAKVALNDGLCTASVGDSFKRIEFEVGDSRETIKAGWTECLSLLLDKRMNWEL